MNPIELQKLLNQPYSRDKWLEVVRAVFPNVQILNPPIMLPVDEADVESFLQLGSVRLADGKALALLEMNLKDSVNLLRNRVHLNKLVSKYIDQDQSYGVLSIFDQGRDDYRFTFASRTTAFDEEKGGFEVRATDAKRYTYVLGANESCKTAAQRLHDLSTRKDEVNLKAIQDAFSVEKLSTEFFKEYQRHYKAMVDHLLLEPSYKQTVFGGDEKAVRDFVKLTLGRLVFIQFVQKKRWMGVPAHDQGWNTGDPDFLANSFLKYPTKDNFYAGFLAPLFFEALNQSGRKGDLFPVTGTKVPFLNGGLFEKGKLATDFVNFSASLFEQLFDFFGRYNFTIDENDPLEEQVGIDPEMLGHIFENLLEDNKDKGTFYTPKEIVHYMCQESLIEYLKTYLENQGLQVDDDMEAKLGRFVRHKEAAGVIDLDRMLATALRDVKICDPAIGSGAFPMGLLNEIFHCVHQLHDASPDNVGDVWGMDAWQPGHVKKSIIQNSIYGVDIEKGAVDIARLRFWLSLILDEEEPSPLPNLDYRIVVGNSLVSKLDDEIIDIDWEVKPGTEATIKLQSEIQASLKLLFAAQRDFFGSKGEKDALKLKIRNLKIDVLITQLKLDLFKYAVNTATAGSLFGLTAKERKAESERGLRLAGFQNTIDRLADLRRNPAKLLNFFDWKLDFPEVLNETLNSKPGFDIVIGNPPYGSIFSESDKDYVKKCYDYCDYQFDIYMTFFEKSFKITKTNASLFFIVPNTWLLNLKTPNIRKLLFSTNNTKKIRKYDYSIFADAIVDNVIVCAEKRITRSAGLTVQILHKDGRIIESHFDGNDLARNYSKPLNIHLSQSSSRISSRFSNWTKLSDVAKITQGAKPFQIGKGKPKQDQKIMAEKPYIQPFKKDDSFRPLLRGSLIGKYTIKWNDNYYISFGEWLAEPRISANYDAREKIVIRQTGSSLIAALDDRQFIVRDNLYTIVSKDGRFGERIILGFLNSRLLNWYYQNVVNHEVGEALAQIKRGHLSVLPIPSINHHLFSKVESFVNIILIAKKSDIEAKTDIIEAQVDQLVYRLYDLSYEEVLVVDPEFGLSREAYEQIVVE